MADLAFIFLGKDLKPQHPSCKAPEKGIFRLPVPELPLNLSNLACSGAHVENAGDYFNADKYMLQNCA